MFSKILGLGVFPVSVIECFLLLDTHILFKGPRYLAFYEVKRVGHALACHWGTSPSVLLNAFYHIKHEYIMFRGEDLNCFRDIKPFMK